MTSRSRRPFRAAPAAALAFALALALPAAAAPKDAGWRIPTAVKTLPNGLTVVVSEDHSAPTFGLCIAYRIGFRLEPKGRTGFAHLFEHMMFQGTPNAPKGTYDRVIEGGGGINNGSTRYDYTNYIVSAPLSALEPVLWLEADRMKMLDFSEKNLAQPEGGRQGGDPRQRPEQALRPLLLDRRRRHRLRQVGERPRRVRLLRRPRRGAGRRREGLLRELLRPEQRRPGDRRRHHARRGLREGREVLRRDPGPPGAAEARREREGEHEGTDPRADRRPRERPGRRDRLEDARPRHEGRHPRRGPREPPRRRRGLAPLPGARQGQGAPPRHRGGPQLAARRRLHVRRARRSSPSSASTSPTPPRRRSSPPSTPRSPPSRRAA